MIFLVAQSRSAHPVVPLDLFRTREVTVAVTVGFAFVVAYYGLPFVMSLYLQQLPGLSPFATGVAFLPMMLIQAAVTPFVALIAEKLGARVLITAGMALMTTGLTVLASAQAPAPVWLLAVLMGLVEAPRSSAPSTRSPSASRGRSLCPGGSRRPARPSCSRPRSSSAAIHRAHDSFTAV